jgi:hypothetical protein
MTYANSFCQPAATRLQPLALETPDEGAGRNDTAAWDTRGEWVVAQCTADRA